MHKKLILFSTLLGVFAFVLFSAFNMPQDAQKKGGKWEIPEKYQKLVNPHKNDADLTAIGKTLYAKHCRACHGNTGKGDGPKAARLQTVMNSFASAEFQAQSDGVIYYQSIVGRDEMINFETKIVEEEDRWAVVNFLRTLK